MVEQTDRRHSERQKQNSLTPDEALLQLVLIQNEVQKIELVEEFSVQTTNETRRVSQYFQAASWQINNINKPSVLAISGMSFIDPNSTLVAFLIRFIKFCCQRENAKENQVLSITDVDEELQQLWQEHMPPFVFWMPFVKDGTIDAGMVFFYKKNLSPRQQTLLVPLSQTYTHAWYSLEENRRHHPNHVFRFTRARTVKIMAIVLLMLILVIPVRESALAPAVISAYQPVIVSSRVSAVVENVHVEANQQVVAGQLLVSLDATESLSDVEISQKELELAQAEYLLAAQQAFEDTAKKAEILLLQSRVDAAMLRLKLAQTRLERMRIYAPKDGVAIYADAYDLIGKPISVGERILLIADTGEVEIDVFMPIGDAIDFRVGDAVSLFLNTDPSRPIEGELRQTSFESREGPDGQQVFELKATITDSNFKGRIGWAGTAKVYSSERISLFMYLFRRPIASARRFFGL